MPMTPEILVCSTMSSTAFFCGVMLRRVRYRDAVSGKIFTFMTTELNLPPGIIAFLYKLRWDVEKVFDEKKSKLHEQKAWATSPQPHGLV
jgi:hypothetical protein